MVSKKTESPLFSKEYKPGHRKCEKCGNYTKGPKSLQCANPDCKAKFPATQSGKPPKGNNPFPIKASFSDTLETLSAIRKGIKDMGGYDKVMDTINQIEKLGDTCGGIARLKEAITTLKEWE